METNICMGKGRQFHLGLVATASNNRPFPVIQPLRQNIRSLRAQTKQFLRVPLDSWTRKEVSRGRFLMEAWNHATVSSRTRSDDFQELKLRQERATYQSKILRQLVNIRRRKNSFLQTIASSEMVDWLHQCLDGWRVVAKQDDGAISKAINLFDLVEDTGILLSDKTYSMYLNILSEQPGHPHAHSIFGKIWQRRQLQDEKSHPDLPLYNSMLHFLAKLSYHVPHAADQAEKVLEQCSRQHNPDESCFVSVMHAWANRHSKHGASRAEAILDHLIDSNPILVTPESFNVCIDGWAKAEVPIRAEKLLWKMQRLSRRDDDHPRPTIVSYNSAIHAWTKSDQPEAPKRAERIFRSLEQHGLQPTLETYTSLMNVWAHQINPGPHVERLLERLEELYSQSPTRNPAPNKITYIIAIRAWAATETEEAPIRADALVRRMDQMAISEHNRRDLTPCSVVYSALLAVWAKSRRSDTPDHVLELVQEMLASNKMTTSLLNLVLGILASWGRDLEAHNLLRSVKDESIVRPDINSWDIVLRAYSKSKKADAAQHAISILRELQGSQNLSLHPTVYSYVNTMVALGNQSSHDAPRQVQELFKELLNKVERDGSFEVSIVAANCVLRAWARSQEGGAAEKAEAFFEWLEDKGPKYQMVPDATSFFHLMQAWAHSGRSIGPQKVEKYFSGLKCLCESSTTDVLNVGHYNLLIAAWAKSHHADAYTRINDLVGDMLSRSAEGQDVSPNSLTRRYVGILLDSSNDSDRISSIKTLLNRIDVERGTRTGP